MNREKSIVSNTGPLISLEKIQDGYTFIRKLYDKIIIPPSVLEEVSQGAHASPSDYLNDYNITDLIKVESPPATAHIAGIERLHQGERDAISLAISLQSPLLIEETVGRRIAVAAGLHISGIAGQIIKGFKNRTIGKTESAQKLKELFDTGRINQEIYDSLIHYLA